MLLIIMDQTLNFRLHILNIVVRAKQRAYLIHRCFRNKSPYFLIRAFKTYVRPTLEYASKVWSPFLLKDIDKIESIQRTFTKRLLADTSLSYPDRLTVMNLKSLEERRLKTDLIIYHKILRGHLAVDSEKFFTPANYSKFPESK